jgi:conjugative transfer signal peptidase TraF
MPASRNLAVTHWGDEFRRILAERRRRRQRAICGTIAIAAASLTLTVPWKPPVLLVWNVSASAPVGLYRVRANEPVKKGDMVIAWTPKVARRLAAARRYVPLNVPLVKRVAARAGDRVCAVGKTIGINGRRVALRLKTDAAGRPMPWWFGCRKLRTGEYFLLMGRPDSFDGRYFGFSDERDLVGRAVLLWAKPAKGFNGG